MRPDGGVDSARCRATPFEPPSTSHNCFRRDGLPLHTSCFEIANGFAPFTGSSCRQLADVRCWLTGLLRSPDFRRLPRYYEALRPCVPLRYVPSCEVRSLEAFPLHRDDRFPRSAEEPGSG